MARHVSLTHTTAYRYSQPARLSPQLIRLRPAPHCRTNILSYSLKILPEEHFINWQQDPYSNYVARIVFPDPIPEFRIEVNLVAELSVYNPFDFFLEPEYEFFHKRKLDPLLASHLHAYLGKWDQSEPLEHYRKSISTGMELTMDFLVQLNAAVQRDIDYTIRLEPGIQSPEETLSLGTGSCRDSAILLIHLLRSFGFAARFVSGYLIQLTADEKPLEGPEGPQSDFTDLHAWAEVYLPGAGWLGLDPTSGLLAGEGHLPLACSPDPAFASPVSGALEKVETEFHFDMKVERIREVPRIAKPYSDEAWERLCAIGDQIDECLRDQDIRLSMGGEPTFISLDDPEGEEWNNAAVGPFKRQKSAELLRKLWLRFGKGGLLHHGQGKWYPGEELPRWAYTCYWRRDGEALWSDATLLADIERDYGLGADEAQSFARTLGKLLGVRIDTLLPAYEDSLYYAWKERKLPPDIEAKVNNLQDPEERERLTRIFENEALVPKGWVLPIQKMWQAQLKWVSTPWKTRSSKLFLVPGDSPVGLRLPLDSLMWVEQTSYPHVINQDPFDRREPSLQPSSTLLHQFRDRAKDTLREENDPSFESAEEITAQSEQDGPIARTAICVEPREGKLFVFLPPVATLEDYLELVAAVEATAGVLKMPVILEGEKPPFDSRISQFSITPDPGVIEVNVQPAHSWRELVHIQSGLYEDARMCRLGTSKFMLDGRHTGTGGGNHIVLGAEYPEDSPFLIRPDLLRSLIAYWHHHPSLSYLFSSLFVGPTSQSPRIDEARDDSLHEMEIAFREVERLRGNCPPWLTDRIFRNLLTDVAGNTHRAEFCIDKLYNPDSSNGRLGLLEMRAFEMPPSSRMSLAQSLLIRALVVRFWEQPYYPQKLVRWGTVLHDRMMLPHYIWEDFKEVLADITASGFKMEEEWYLAHLEFRYPYFGAFQYRDIQVELRQAMEPWHVLGEEGLAGSTVRFVDASVERVQIKIEHFQPERYMLTCNRERVPLQSTGVKGQFVAGIRFRAWQPSSALHPYLPVDAPLVFDLVDLWNMRAVAGCRYHVVHPGGRNYETFPVNAYEAESRRLSRFDAMGHHPHPYLELPDTKPLVEFPTTLDLRCCSKEH